MNLRSIFPALALPLFAACADQEEFDLAEDPTEESEDAITTGCGADYAEVLVYSPAGGTTDIRDKVKGGTNRCTHYYFTIPLNVDDKTSFHPQPLVGREIKAIHDLGPNFHVLAQFQFSAWANWVKDPTKKAEKRTWYKAGVEFRRRMDDIGLSVFKGASDTWFVDELGSTLLRNKPTMSNDEYRDLVVELARGLFDGGRLKNKKGGLAHAGHPHTDTREATLAYRKGFIEDLLLDQPFWVAMGKYTRWFAEEVYASPYVACAKRATVGEKAVSLNGYLQHYVLLGQHKEAAPAARSYLSKFHVPLAQAGWLNGSAWGDTMVSPETMKRFLSLEVYSTRAFDTNNPNSGRRIGFAVVPPRLVTPDSIDDAVEAKRKKLVQEGVAPARRDAILDALRRELEGYRREQRGVLVPAYEAEFPTAPLPIDDAARDKALATYARSVFDDVLMSHLGSALDGAYGTRHDLAVDACLTQGTVTGCDCSVPGVKLDRAWNRVFSTW